MLLSYCPCKKMFDQSCLDVCPVSIPFHKQQQHRPCLPMTASKGKASRVFCVCVSVWMSDEPKSKLSGAIASENFLLLKEVRWKACTCRSISDVKTSWNGPSVTEAWSFHQTPACGLILLRWRSELTWHTQHVSMELTLLSPKVWGSQDLQSLIESHVCQRNAPVCLLYLEIIMWLLFVLITE